MLKELIRTKDKNPTLDNVSDKIDETIDHYISDDIFIKIFPILSPKEMTRNDDFFKINNITPNREKNFSSDELKTISYMANYYKEKVKYSVGEIERYLKFIGYDLSERATDIVCIEKDGDYEPLLETNISFQTYLTLPNEDFREYKHTLKHFINSQKAIHLIKNSANGNPELNGWDAGFDIVRTK